MEKLIPGALLKWEDLTEPEPIVHIGLFVKYGEHNKATYPAMNQLPWPAGFGDIVVLSNGREENWVSWQCEVINESR